MFTNIQVAGMCLNVMSIHNHTGLAVFINVSIIAQWISVHKGIHNHTGYQHS